MINFRLVYGVEISHDNTALFNILYHYLCGIFVSLLVILVSEQWSDMIVLFVYNLLTFLHFWINSTTSVDRKLLLRFIHCCAASDAQQGAPSGLLKTLQHRLDLSCSSCVELTEKDQTEPLSLTFVDCRAVSTILRHSSRNTQLDLRDCEVEDSSLDLLFPVLDRVCLR